MQIYFSILSVISGIVVTSNAMGMYCSCFTGEATLYNDDKPVVRDALVNTGEKQETLN